MVIKVGVVVDLLETLRVQIYNHHQRLVLENVQLSEVLYVPLEVFRLYVDPVFKQLLEGSFFGKFGDKVSK